MSTDSCLQRPTPKTASATVYLMEELGDARMRCDQLVKYIAEAAKLIESSSHRDHFFEVAGHLIQGIPRVAFLLQKALQATALAAARIDYEEIKQELRPEKVEELERVLEDARIRQVQRRSEPLTPEQAIKALRQMVATLKASGQLPKADLAALILALETGLKTAGITDPAQVLEDLAVSIETAQAAPSQLHLATLLRRVLAEDLLTTTQERPTMNELSWKTPGATTNAAEMPAKFDPTFQQQLALMMKNPPKVSTRDEGVVIEVFSPFVKKYIPMAEYADENVANKELSIWMKAHRETIQNLRTMKGKEAAEEEAKESRFEEGKPADPTKNMSPEDAKKWKTEHDKNKDKFKSAGLEGELREMQDILKANGYNPTDAMKLQDEGMGPDELEHRIRSTKPSQRSDSLGRRPRGASQKGLLAPHRIQATEGSSCHPARWNGARHRDHSRKHGNRRQACGSHRAGDPA